MVEIQRIKYGQKATLRNLLELYKYDFSEFDPEDVNENGLYEYRYLDHYWTEEGRHPFFIRVDDRLAGFALVRETGTDEQNRSVYWMAEFFVMKKYRHLKVGQTASHQLFNLFPGVWQVGQIDTNEPAQQFWRKTIGKYTNGNYQETRQADWDGPIQRFSTHPQV